MTLIAFFAIELHPEDYLVLAENFKADKRIKTLQQNGYAALKALLPPKENRGLILIDPPFEETDEFAQIVAALTEGLKRFAHGLYAIWYPIKDKQQVNNFYNQLKTLAITKCLHVEISANENILNQLDSCGMVIINPPWQLDIKLNENLPKLLDYLEFSQGTYKVKWLLNNDKA